MSCLLPLITMAQQEGASDFLDSTGKIYVVVGVLLLLFLGIIIFLIYLERRLSKLEKEEDWGE